MSFFFLLLTFATTLILLAKISATAKYHLKYLVYYVLIVILTTLATILSLFSPRDIRNTRYLYIIGRILARVLRIRYEVRNRHVVPENKACIVVVNHRTYMDMCGLSTVNLSNSTTLVRRETLTSDGPLGIACWLAGCIFVDRNNHHSAMESMKKCSEIIKRKNVKLIMYPEGKLCYDKNTFLPFKKGAFHLAVQTQVPIVPVVLSSYHFHDEAEKRFDEGKVIVTCLPPVSTAGMTAEDVPELTERIRNDMLETFKITSAETEPSHNSK